jgi:hypothetical protein
MTLKSLKNSTPQSRSLKREKTDAIEPSSRPVEKGITAFHIVKFLESAMDILDNSDKKGCFIIMGNCRIHQAPFVVNTVNKRGYNQPLLMSPYSPFLNSIEEC